MNKFNVNECDTVITSIYQQFSPNSNLGDWKKIKFVRLSQVEQFIDSQSLTIRQQAEEIRLLREQRLKAANSVTCSATTVENWIAESDAEIEAAKKAVT